MQRYLIIILSLYWLFTDAATTNTAIQQNTDSIQTTLVKMLEGQVLGEVTVRGNVPAYKLTDEGVQVNVNNTQLSQAGTAEDVLRHVAGLRKVDDETYEVFGVGEPWFYIDGRQVTDVSELNQLKSQDIKNIVLITNPGAKYDASVKAVVKIKTIRRQGEGLSIDERFVWGQSSNTDLNEQLNLNYRHNGLDLFGMLAIMRIKSYDHASIEQVIYADTLWKQRNEERYEYSIPRFRTNVGMNYVIDGDNSFGMRYSLSQNINRTDYNTFLTTVTANGKYYDGMVNLDQFKVRDNPTQDLHAYYNGKLSGWGVNLDLNWWHNDRSSISAYQEQSQEYNDRNLSTIDSKQATMWAARLVFDHALLGGYLSFGAEYTNTKRTQEYNNPEGYLTSSLTEQHNNTIAPFAEYTHSLPFGTFTAGLRYERSNDEYHKDKVLQSKESRTYDDLFPHLKLQTKTGKVSTVIDYGVTISRPAYKDLDEAVIYGNRFTLDKGNGMLKPAKRHTLSLQSMWKIWRLSVSYTNTHDAMIYWATQQEGNTAVSVMSRRNLESLKTFNAAIMAAPSVGLWHPQFMAGIDKQWLTLQTAQGNITLNDPMFLLSAANTFRFSKTLTGELTLAFMSKGDHETVTVERAQIKTNASITKTFLGERLSIRLGGYDLLFRRQRYKSYNYQMLFIKENDQDTRYAELTIRYTYNSARSKYRGKGAGNNELRRL